MGMKFGARLILLLAGVISFNSIVCGQKIKVTLLGTGSPPPVMDRFGPSVLVEAGDQKLIFDVGRGALQRLTQIKVSPKDLRAVFLTHLHSDHVVGFPDLWLTGWVNGRRDKALRVWGPKGTEKMMSYLEQAFDFDIKIRLYDDRVPLEGVAIEAKDIVEGVVYENNGIKVTAFEVDHPPIKPAFGYRVDYAGRSVVLSGDTKYSENLIKHSQGVDLLLQEVVSLESLKRAGYAEERIKIIINHHTTPEEAGQLFSLVNPKLAVYYHLVLPTVTERDVIPSTRKTYSGVVELGEDLMVVEIGEKIDVRRINQQNLK
jgi:ribonuclease Z